MHWNCLIYIDSNSYSSDFIFLSLHLSLWNLEFLKLISLWHLYLQTKIDMLYGLVDSARTEDVNF